MDLASMQRPLRQLRKQLKTLRRRAAPEDLHKLRTRARRVQAIAAIGPQPPLHLLQSVNAIRKSAGQVRDLDVIRDFALTLSPADAPDSLPQLLRRIGKLRQRAAARLQKTLHRHSRRLRGDLANYALQFPAAFPPAGASASPLAPPSLQMQKLRRTVACLLRELSSWPECDENNLHDLRIQLKRLRTLVQFLPDPDPTQIEFLSEIVARIGEWHDWQHLAAVAHQTLDSIRDSALLARIDLVTGMKFAPAIEAARSLRKRPPLAAIPPGKEAPALTQHHAA